MWLFFGLGSGMSDSLKNVFAKHNANKFHPIVITWAWITFSLILVVPLMFVEGIPHLNNTFWIALSIRIVLDTTAYILYMYAIQSDDLSLTLPMLSLTPFFLMFTGLFINHEFPKPLGIVAVLCIILGTYFLNFKRGEKFYSPIVAIFQRKGSFLMLIVAILWSFTGSLHKVAILNSNPFFYTGFGSLVLALALLPLAFLTARKDFQEVINPKKGLQLLPLGLFEGGTVLLQMIGQSITLSVFVIALKRSNIVFSSLLGWVIFKEKIKNRILPILLMVGGVLLIAVS